MSGQKIRLLRKAHGYTQKGLADALGVTCSTVSMWESGQRSPNPQMLNTLSKLFDESPEYIMRDLDKMEPDYNPFEISNRDTEIINHYLSLDELGKEIVAAITSKELKRCRIEGTVKTPIGFSIEIRPTPSMRTEKGDRIKKYLKMIDQIHDDEKEDKAEDKKAARSRFGE